MKSSAAVRYLVFGALFLFLAGLHLTWIFGERRTRGWAKELLTQNALDMKYDVESSADEHLLSIGTAITRHYSTPQKMTVDTVREIMHRYDIDELNIVDSNGVVLAGELANVGFDFHSNSNTVGFLCLLEDEEAYSQPFRGAIEDPTLVRKYCGVAFKDHAGFVQLGYDKGRTEYELDYHLRGCADGWPINKGGFFIVARAKSGEIVACGETNLWNGILYGPEVQTLASLGYDETKVPDAPLAVSEQMLGGSPCLCVETDAGYYHHVIAVLPLAEVNLMRDLTLLLVAGILFVILLSATLISVRMSDTNAKLKIFIEEDKRRQEEDRRRREEELANAKAIQTESLPMVFPDEPSFRIRALMDTAREVGGDFYDFYTLPSGRELFLIADTCGKGIPAAMFMMKAKAVIRAVLFEGEDFAGTIIDANNRLADHNDANMFVTAWIGMFDPKSGEVEFVNCGHNPPLVKRADGTVEWVRTRPRPGRPLAAMPGSRYRVEKVKLEKGDSLVLYTDGVTEAMNAQGEQFGESRLEAALAEIRGGSAAEPDLGKALIDRIRGKVAEFTAGAEQSDDITMLTLERK